ncbi:MAG: hypothetical protein ACFFES_06205, partial [Candidatus Thorarchaeota archaeon]
MTERIIAYRSIAKTIAAILLGISGSIIVGYVISDYIFRLATGDILINFAAFVMLPLTLTITGFGIGWYGKKNAIVYTEPSWHYEPTQLSIEDTKIMNEEYKRKYWR